MTNEQNTETKTLYLVEEFAAGKWWATRSFNTEDEAREWARPYRKVRIREVGK